MKKFILILLAPFFIGANCNDNVGFPTPVKHANDKPELCGQACTRARNLSCPESSPLVYESRPCQISSECKNELGEQEGSCVKGFCTETCEDVCKALIKNGRHVGTACWITMQSCSEIESKCRK